MKKMVLLPIDILLQGKFVQDVHSFFHSFDWLVA